MTSKQQPGSKGDRTWCEYVQAIVEFLGEDVGTSEVAAYIKLQGTFRTSDRALRLVLWELVDRGLILQTGEDVLKRGMYELLWSPVDWESLQAATEGMKDGNPNT